MAAKGKSGKAPTKVKGSKASKKVAKSRKPHFSAAQRARYRKAFRVAQQKAHFQHRVAALQRKRLQGAATVERKLAIAGTAAKAAALRAKDVSQTFNQVRYSKQSKTLRLQAASRLFKAQSVATQKQFAFLGERLHARTTVLQTLTNAQADKVEAERYRKAVAKAMLRKRRTKAGTHGKRGRPKGSKSKTKRKISPYAAAGRAAGIRARGKPTTTAPKKRGRKAQARRNMARVSGATARSAAAKAAQSRKKAHAKPKPRKAALMRDIPLKQADWIVAGNELNEETCVAVAVANHLLAWTGYRLTDDQVRALDAANPYGTIEGALEAAASGNLWENVRLEGYARFGNEAFTAGTLAGFESDYGPHAGVLMPGRTVVSWGEIVPITAAVEECWFLLWTTET